MFGVEKEITFERDETCSTSPRQRGRAGQQHLHLRSTCGGRGEVRQVRQTFIVQMVETVTCPKCQGRGQIIEKLCHTCNGRGLERKRVTKRVGAFRQAWTADDSVLPGEGQPGANGGSNGNLFLAVDVLPHEFFQRKGEDILLYLDINIAQAVLGAEIEVPTVDGKEKLEIPAGTQPGRVFTLRGKGVPRLRQGGRGDQQVIVNVEIPTRLTAEQRELFEKLARTLAPPPNHRAKGCSIN